MKKPFVIILSVIAVLLLIGLGFFIYVNITYLNKDEIKKIVIQNIGANSHDVYFENIELEIEKNSYEVEIYYNNKEYEYKIDAKNGRIIYNNFQLNHQTNNQTKDQNNNTNNNQNTNTTNQATITMDKAKEIAMQNANISNDNIVYTETKQEYDHGRPVYDIEFIYNHREYNYEIDGITGEIISYDIDHK